MTFDSIILLLIVPLVGAVICAFLSDAIARFWAMFVSLATLAVAVGIALQLWQGQTPSFNPADARIESIGVSFSLAITPISVWLVLLTAFLTPLAIAASFTGIMDRQSEYYAWM